MPESQYAPSAQRRKAVNKLSHLRGSLSCVADSIQLVRHQAHAVRLQGWDEAWLRVGCVS